jgi:hypothetical protein
LIQPKFGGDFQDYSERSPGLVAENSDGVTRVIAVFKSQRDAKDKAGVIESDLETLGPAAW